MPHPLITAVIPSKDRPQRVAALLDNLRRQDYPPHCLEILLIDDGSTPPYALPNSPNLRLLRHDSPRGAQHSRNQALQQAAGPFILMLDDDIELLHSDFISKAAALLESQPRVAAVFGRKFDVLHHHDHTQTRELSASRPNRFTGELTWISPAAGPIDFGNQVYLVRRELLLQIGGYDGIFGLNGGHSFREESDLHARLRQLDYQLWFLPDIAFNHHITPTGGHGPNIPKRLYWIAHNHIIFIRRHLRFWPFLSLGFLFDIARYSWVQGRFRYTHHMLRGYFAGLRNALRDQYPHPNPWLSNP